MKPSPTTRTRIAAGSLWTLTLVACDDPDAWATADEAALLDAEEAELQDGPIDAEEELRELCESAHPPAEASPGADEFTADTPEAKGVCSYGEWDYVYVSKPCGSCWHTQIDKPGWRHEMYRRFCYRAPSPPSCGCEPDELFSWSCNGAGVCQ